MEEKERRCSTAFSVVVTAVCFAGVVSVACLVARHLLYSPPPSLPSYWLFAFFALWLVFLTACLVPLYLIVKVLLTMREKEDEHRRRKDWEKSRYDWYKEEEKSRRTFDEEEKKSRRVFDEEGETYRRLDALFKAMNTTETPLKCVTEKEFEDFRKKYEVWKNNVEKGWFLCIQHRIDNAGTDEKPE